MMKAKKRFYYQHDFCSWGKKGNAGQANYAVLKAGVIGFTKSVAGIGF